MPRLGIRGTSILEYAIGVTAAGMIAVGAGVPFFSDLRSSYFQIAGIIHNPPVILITRKATDDTERDISPDEGDGYEDPGQGEDIPDDGSSPDSGTDPESSTGPEESPDLEGCGEWSYFNFGFVDMREMVQIHVPGTFIGLHNTNGNPKKKKDQSINLDDVEELGDETTEFVLAIEYDGVNEYFTQHNRISVFSMKGEKIITRALVKYESPGDIREGDEYVIAHTKDFIIDLAGTLFGNRSYDENSQSGSEDVGNNDNLLSFHDIGCVIYRPEE